VEFEEDFATRFRVEEAWQSDMENSFRCTSARFDMSRVERQFDEYQAKEVSWRRVENSYWEDIRNQTQDKVREY
jgi:hypothetical protein